MAMTFRPFSILRWTMPVFLCVGLCGLGGCSSRYHSQHSSAIGGGHIGKGHVGRGAKKRGGYGLQSDFGGLSADTGLTSDPFGGLGEIKRNKAGVIKSTVSPYSNTTRAARKAPESPLFDLGPRAPRARANDPFSGL